jgi:hypothetical protein
MFIELLETEAVSDRQRGKRGRVKDPKKDRRLKRNRKAPVEVKEEIKDEDKDDGGERSN